MKNFISNEETKKSSEVSCVIKLTKLVSCLSTCFYRRKYEMLKNKMSKSKNNYQPWLIMKKDKKLKCPQAGPTGLGDGKEVC